MSAELDECEKPCSSEATDASTAFSGNCPPMSVATAAARRHIVQHDKLMPNGQEHQAVEHFFDLGPREVHPWQRPAVPSPEALAKSPHYPVVVTANPMVKDQVMQRPASHAVAWVKTYGFTTACEATILTRGIFAAGV